MYHTQYTKAENTQAATQAISDADDGKFLAGGMTLIPTMKQRLAAPDLLVDLSACNLSFIEETKEGVKIGAMTTHADVASSTVVQSKLPSLAHLARRIGDPQVRNRGTIGGSLANNDPSACYPAAILALGGVIHTSQRDIKADDFFVGLFETALNEDEIIEAVSLPESRISAYVKFPNPASRYAMVGVFVAKLDTEISVAVTGAGDDGVFRCTEIEQALTAEFSASALEGIEISAENLMGDIHASPEYRARLIIEMAKRAVTAC